MSLISVSHSQTSVILRVKILNSSVSTGAGLTGLTEASSGLIISTITNNEAAATAYTAAGSTIETITTLGTYAAPTATKCRFKEVDATNHKGVYEIHLADARFAVASAEYLIVSISGATNAAETDVVIPLTKFNFTSGTKLDVNVLEINSVSAAAVRLALSAGQIIPGTVDTVTNGHTPTTTEFQADDITEATADHYNGRLVVWTSGALVGQVTDVTDYSLVGGIGQFTVSALTEAPANNDTFILV